MLRGPATGNFFADDLDEVPYRVGRRRFRHRRVVDPFGNVLGIMYDPHYLEILGR